MFHDFVCSPDDSDIVPGAVASTTTQNVSSVYKGEQKCHQDMKMSIGGEKTYQFPMIWAGDMVVTRIYRFRMWPTPNEYLVMVNLWVVPVLEREREVGV